MAFDRSASSSDLENARRISQRLRGPRAPEAVPPPNAPGYIRFSAAMFVGGVPAAPPLERFGPAVWDALLEQASAAAGAELAFVIDAQGLVIASHGDVDPALVQGIGARLEIAFEQADQMSEMGEAPQSIAIEFRDKWLTGIRIRRGEGQTFTVGVLGPNPAGREARLAMEPILARA